MNAVDRVKALCKAKKIPLYKLEKDLGFANGYIGQLRKGTLPADRLEKIAEYLEVSSAYILTGEDKGHYSNPITADIAQKIYESPELYLLFFDAQDAKPEDLRTAHQMLMALKRKEIPD